MQELHECLGTFVAAEVVEREAAAQLLEFSQKRQQRLPVEFGGGFGDLEHQVGGRHPGFCRPLLSQSGSSSSCRMVGEILMNRIAE